MLTGCGLEKKEFYRTANIVKFHLIFTVYNQPTSTLFAL